MGKGFVSETMAASRILSHGQITSLPFSLSSGLPFSIFIIPVVDSDLPVLVNCKLEQDDAAANCPFNVKQWTEPAVSIIPTAGINLTNYNVYWGAAYDVTES